MSRTMQALALAALMTTLSTATAQNTLAGSPFVTALKNGKASAAPPPGVLSDFIMKQLQGKTGSTGEILMEVHRVSRFKSQPSCGRVLFGLYQPSSNTFWGQLGGQLNVCEDGTPPLKVCKSAPGQLVLPNHVCADKSRPVESPEVAAAISTALADGGMTIDQFRRSLEKPVAKDRIAK